MAVPGVPTGLSITAVFSNAVQLNWTDVATATGYKIYRSTDDVTYEFVLSSETSDFIDHYVHASTLYYYKVLAYNDDGDGALCSSVNDTTLAINIIHLVLGNQKLMTFDSNGYQSQTDDGLGSAIYTDGKIVVGTIDAAQVNTMSGVAEVAYSSEVFQIYDALGNVIWKVSDGVDESLVFENMTTYKSFTILNNGEVQPETLADADAANNSIYYSSTAGKLVYKDGSGTVHNLY